MEQVSNINQIGAAFTLIMAVLFLVLPRKYAVMPLLMTVLYLPLGQVLIIASLNFTMFRIMILVGFIRIVMKKEYDFVKLNIIDYLLILYVASCFITQIILWQTSAEFVNRLGFAYNAIGIYFLFRCLIRNNDDYSILLKIMALIIVPVAIAGLIEMKTGRNLLSIFGGVPEFSAIRNGRIRCQMSFNHPILSGTFGATSMPLFIALFFKENGRDKNLIIGIIGFTCATIIMVVSSSSGPLIAYLFGIIGLMIWPFRSYMRAIRWGIFFVLISLHVVMNAPVWYLMARLAAITGGTGWHRSQLVDQWLRHFNEWWLLGTKKTSHWMGGMHLLNRPDDADITNHFVGVAVNGGLISLILFILIIIYCYKRLGVSLQLEKNASINIKMLLWTLGVSLFAHIMSFMSVAYFDQIIVFWYMLIAVISSLTTANYLNKKQRSDTLIGIAKGN